MRLYHAICELIEAKAHQLSQDEQEEPRDVDMPPSAVKHSGLRQRGELDMDASHRSEDWSEDPDQARRRQRIGFSPGGVGRPAGITTPRHEMKEGPAPDPYGWPAHPQVREARRRGA